MRMPTTRMIFFLRAKDCPPLPHVERDAEICAASRAAGEIANARALSVQAGGHHGRSNDAISRMWALVGLHLKWRSLGTRKA
eukprot:9443040-Pyramimonas_sp.AAC.1